MRLEWKDLSDRSLWSGLRKIDDHHFHSRRLQVWQPALQSQQANTPPCSWQVHIPSYGTSIEGRDPVALRI